MLCGIKFCGGCNPRYDRGKAAEELQRRLAAPEFRFEYAKEEVVYDALVVIGGCPACCATCSQYSVKGSVIKMWEEGHLEETFRRLQKTQ